MRAPLLPRRRFFGWCLTAVAPALAASPATASHALPDPWIVPLGLVGAIAIGAAVVAGGPAARDPSPARPRARAAGAAADGMLRPRARRRLPAGLPCPSDRRAALSARLRALSLIPATSGALGPGCAAPAHPDSAIATILQRILAAWKATRTDDLSDAQVADLLVLDRLLTAPAEEAGSLSMLFSNPDRVLALRARVVDLAARRAEFDRQHAALDAAYRTWSRTREAPQPGDLCATLAAHGTGDPDLLHHVVARADTDAPDQRAAALWCARAPDADRATVALFLARVARGRLLSRAATEGDRAFVDGVAALMSDLQAGAGTTGTLALDPPDAVLNAGPALAEDIARTAGMLGIPPLPVPRGLFVEYAGRPPRPRTEWDLAAGGMVRAPDAIDYYDPALVGLSA